MIQYNTSSSGILQQYDFSLSQSGFLAAGNFPIPISGAVFMMIMYQIPDFNNTWNTNNPNIIFLTDNTVINRVVLGFSGGGTYSSPTFTKYPDANIDATISANSATVQWNGDAGLIVGGASMLFSLFYIVRSF